MHLRDTVCCTEFERPTLEGVFLKTRVSRWARSFRLDRKKQTGYATNHSAVTGWYATDITARGQITCISTTQCSTLLRVHQGEHQILIMMFTRAEHTFTHTYLHDSKKWLPKALINNIKLSPAIQKHLFEYFHSTKSSSFPILQTKTINMRSIQQLFILKLM